MREKSNFTIPFNGSEYSLWEQRQMLKHGHELLCDCGQPLDPEGVCTSCNPPEEAEEVVLERESRDPKPLNFDKEKERKYEPELQIVDAFDVFDEDYLEYIREEYD